MGDTSALPLPLDQLLALDETHPNVVEAHTGGLTGFMYRLRTAHGDWNIKRARSSSLVLNPECQTSFLNEVQRRCELEALGDDCRRRPSGKCRLVSAALMGNRQKDSLAVPE